jgi:hypothetical protein
MQMKNVISFIRRLKGQHQILKDIPQDPCDYWVSVIIAEAQLLGMLPGRITRLSVM